MMTSNWRGITWCAVSVALLLLAGCGRKEKKDALATVGDIWISPQEFLHRFEFTVHPQIPGDRKATKRIFMDALLTEKMLAAEGARAGLDRAPRTRAFLAQIEKEALVEALIDTEIKPTVQVSEEELRAAFVRSKTEWEAEFVAVKDSTQLAELYARLDRQQDLVEAAKGLADSVYQQLFRGGQARPEIENALAGLSPGMVSAPVAVQGTYLVFRLRDRRSEALLTENDYLNARASLLKKLRERKTGESYWEYSRKLLRERKDFALQPEVFHQLAEALYAAFNSNGAESLQARSVNLGEKQIVQLERDAQLDKAQVLVRFKDGTSWTVEEVIARLAVGPYPLRQTSKAALARSLRDSIPLMVLIETLAEEARKKGLDKSEYVRKEKRMWREAVLAERMAALVLNSVTLSEADLAAYVAEDSTRAGRDRRQLEAELLAARQKAALRRRINHLKAQYRPEVDQAVLDSLTVTTTPMYLLKTHYPGRPAVPGVAHY